MKSSLDRGDIKLAYDRAVAHDVEDVAEMLVTFAEYIERLEKQRNELLAAAKLVLGNASLDEGFTALTEAVRNCEGGVRNDYSD